MKRIKLTFTKILILSFGAVLVLTFGQNCSPGFVVDDSFFNSLSLSAESVEFLAAKSVMQQKCNSCHGSTAAPELRFDFANEQQFLLSGLIVAGSPDQSKLIRRLRNYQGTVTGLPANMPTSGPLSADEYSIMRRWVASAAYAGEFAPYTCNANESTSNRVLASDVKSLGRAQYKNTIQDFLAMTVPAYAQGIYQRSTQDVVWPFEGIARYTRTVGEIDKPNLAAMFTVADNIGRELSQSSVITTFVSKVISLNPGRCVYTSVETLSADCKDQFVRNLGVYLYRRPLLETGEVNEVQTFGAEFTLNADNASAVSSLVVRFMMSQNFLFQMEDQETRSTADPNLLQLSSFSIVNRLSYTFWNSMPDEALLQMAASNDLQIDTRFLSALEYVMANANSDRSAKEFANGWLLLRKAPNFAASSEDLPSVAFDANMRAAMVSEAEDLVAYTVRSGGSFPDIFNTDISFTRYTPLMQVYGVSAPAPTTITAQNAVRMPVGSRAGILTRAALLAESNGRQHLIRRAIRLKRDLLCLSTPPPPADTSVPVPLTEAQIQSYTLRQQFSHNTGSGICVSCHQSINPFGYALSKYDGFGMYGQTEHAKSSTGVSTGVLLPTDSQSDLGVALPGAPSVSNAVELSSVVSDRREAQACFAKNYATYLLGRDANPAREGCRLNKVIRYLGRQNQVKDALTALATDREFRLRRLSN